MLSLSEDAIWHKPGTRSFWVKVARVLGKSGVSVVIRNDIFWGFGETHAQVVADHDQNVERLLQRAQEVNLKLNKDKVKLRQTEVKFMGHLITKDGLKPDPDKVTAIENMPKPKTKAEVATLLGFVNYLTKFLPRLSEVANLKIACLPVPFIAIFVISVTICHNDRLTWAMWSNCGISGLLNCRCCIVFIAFSCLPISKIACLPVPSIAIFFIFDWFICLLIDCSSLWSPVMWMSRRRPEVWVVVG